MPGSEPKVDCDTVCLVSHDTLHRWDTYMMGHVFMLPLIEFTAGGGVHELIV